MLHMHMYVNNDSQQASARAVCVVQFLFKTDSRTERLRALLTLFSKLSLYRLYVYPAINVCGFSEEIIAALE